MRKVAAAAIFKDFALYSPHVIFFRLLSRDPPFRLRDSKKRHPCNLAVKNLSVHFSYLDRDISSFPTPIFFVSRTNCIRQTLLSFCRRLSFSFLALAKTIKLTNFHCAPFKWSFIINSLRVIKCGWQILLKLASI